MKFAECKNHKESIGLLFWQSSMLWQRKIKQILQSYNLTHTQFVILAVIEELSEQDICITQKRISDFSMIDVMTVSSTVRLLEKKGLIYRLPHKTDTRANSISNTEKGKICLKQAVIDVEGIDRTFFFNSDEENAQFKNMLSQLLSKNLE
ncbi:MarR family transcriptional regulator [Butyricicoccus sp. 1XD8-22]|nr:MarR family transcriptional regulator [Butyricicoccus sp. 1XD8-22]